MKRYLTVLLLTIAIAGTAAADEGKKLSLKEAIRLAIENNLDLKAELYSPALAEAEIRKSRAMYETRLTIDTSYQYSDPYSALLGSGVEQSTYNFTPAVSQLLSSGGTISLKYQNQYQYNSAAVPFGRYWTSSLGLAFSQPLLKNFGRDTTELNIKISEISKDASVSHLRSLILSTVAQVRTEYFKMWSVREDLESRKASLELAQKILSETQARVKAGVLPAMEILNSQFGVSSREKELIDAEKAVSDQIDILSQLIRLERVTDIVTTDKPVREKITINEADALNKAISSRPETEELKAELKISEVQSAVARNQTKASLNLVSSVALTGLDREYGRNNERLNSLDYPAWSVGLQLDYPLGNQAAENDYIKSRLKADQVKVQLASLNSSITNEVKIAIRAVNSSFKQLDVAEKARQYAAERVKAYMKKSEVGLATTKDLLDVENDLATARANQIKAEVQYVTSLNQYWKSTGELLEREGIVIDASRSDDLYKGVK